MVNVNGKKKRLSNADWIALKLRKWFGFDAAEVAGVEANFQVESGLNPTAYNAAEGAIGFGQWEGGRRVALDRFAAAHGWAETDRRAQLGYFRKELNGPYASVLALVRGSHDPGEVAAIVDVGPGGANSGTGYENSSGETTQTRITDARAIYAKLAAGQPIGGSTNAGGGDASAVDAGFTTAFPGGAADPLNWPGELLGDAAGGILKVVLPFATKVAFVIGGLALVVVGVNHAAEPMREKAAPMVEPIATAAA